MNRINQLFEQKKNNVLSIYFTAGHPDISCIVPILKALQDAGTDIVEIGIPYNDPLADGHVIQQSSAQAIASGVTIEKLLQQLKSLRPEISLPVILMGYYNPVFQYGFEKFCADASAAGVDGLIIPDLPDYEYQSEYKQLLTRHGLCFSFLVTPATSEERVKYLDGLSTGFIYAVSSLATTGHNYKTTAVIEYLKRLRTYNLRNPVLTGFGFNAKSDFKEISSVCNGFIIGSAYVEMLSKSKEIEADTAEFISQLKIQ